MVDSTWLHILYAVDSSDLITELYGFEGSQVQLAIALSVQSVAMASYFTKAFIYLRSKYSQHQWFYTFTLLAVVPCLLLLPINTLFSSHSQHYDQRSPHWIRKMKTAFQVLDTNHDSAIIRTDIEGPLSAMMDSFNAPPEKKEKVLATAHRYWINLVNGGTEPPTDDTPVTEEQFLKNVARAIGKPEFQDTMEDLGTTLMSLLDSDDPENITREEFMHMYAAHNVHKDKAEEDRHFQLFEKMDTDEDGDITQEDYVRAVQFFFTDLTDESDPRNWVFGPLRTD